MAGKQESAETSWRKPLAQKLSSLINRRTSVKSADSKPQDGTLEKRSSVFRSKRQDPQPPRSASVFKPLEVDLAASESEGWLQTEERKHKERENEQQEQPQAVPDRTKTPIADLFASKSVLNFDLGDAQSHDHSKPSKRPLSMLEPQFIAQQNSLGDGSIDKPPFESAGSDSILNRGRPVESRYSYVEVPAKPELPPLQPVSRESTSVRRAASADARRSWAGAMPEPGIQNQPAVPRSTISSRHSIVEPQMPVQQDLRSERVALRSQSPAAPTRVGTNSSSRSSSAAAPLDRIQSWQKSIPTKVAQKPAAPAAAEVAAPPGFAPLRRASTRGVSDRLAWIRELEDKKSRNANQDMGGLKRAQTGSVSTKLALFENKQALAVKPAATVRPSALNRSNSTTSRFSAVGPDSSLSVTSNVSVSAATPRTSLDTVRSSNRASSVMSYYDDSFREKMENLVGSDNYSPDVEKPDMLNKQKVSARFVPVEPKKAEEVVKAEEIPSIDAPAQTLEQPAVSEEPKVEEVAQAEEAPEAADGPVVENTPAPAVAEAPKEAEAPVMEAAPDNVLDVPQIIEPSQVEEAPKIEAPAPVDDAPKAEETPEIEVKPQSKETPKLEEVAKVETAPTISIVPSVAEQTPEVATPQASEDAPKPTLEAST
jgi:hypothetical protein